MTSAWTGAHQTLCAIRGGNTPQALPQPRHCLLFGPPGMVKPGPNIPCVVRTALPRVVLCQGLWQKGYSHLDLGLGSHKSGQGGGHSSSHGVVTDVKANKIVAYGNREHALPCRAWCIKRACHQGTFMGTSLALHWCQVVIFVPTSHARATSNTGQGWSKPPPCAT